MDYSNTDARPVRQQGPSSKLLTASPTPVWNRTSRDIYRFPKLLQRLSERREKIGLASKEELIQDELNVVQASLGPVDSNWPYDVQTLAKFIHNNIFEEWLNVTEARLRCGFRNNNVSSRFKYAVGMGMRQYIECLRMETAGWLLAHEANFQVFLIALSIGYASAESFNKGFRRYYDCTPTEFRVIARHFERTREHDDSQPPPRNM